MAMTRLAAEQNANPILPSSNEVIWGLTTALLVFLVVAALVVVVLVARYFVRLLRTAETAAENAAAAEAEVHALRTELERNGR